MYFNIIEMQKIKKNAYDVRLSHVMNIFFPPNSIGIESEEVRE